MHPSPCRNSQGAEICDLTFRVYNDTANGFLDSGAMEVEDVDQGGNSTEKLWLEFWLEKRFDIQF